MKEIELIKCLIEEIEKEGKYKEEYEKEVVIAEKKADKAKKEDGRNHWYEYYMPEEFQRKPTEARIKRCAMLIRDLCLTLYK